MKKGGFFCIIIVIALAVTLPACVVSAGTLTFYTVNAVFTDSSSARLAGAVADPGAEAYVSGYFMYGTNLDTCSSSTCFTTTPIPVYLLTPPDLFYRDITGLTPGTQYWFRFCIIGGSSGSSYCDGTATFTTLPTLPPTAMSASPLTVTTGSAADVVSTSATLHGNLGAMGGELLADVFFEYGPLGNLDWSAGAGTLSSAGAFSAPISDLRPFTVYSFRACATASGAVVCGPVVPFMTGEGPTATLTLNSMSAPTIRPTPGPTPVVVSLAATNLVPGGATLNGELDDMLVTSGETGAVVYFEYFLSSGRNPPISSVDAGTLSSPGTFSAAISDVPSDFYYFRACASTTPTGYVSCGANTMLVIS